MTGTGACVFGSFPNEGEADKVRRQLPATLPSFVARGRRLDVAPKPGTDGTGSECVAQGLYDTGRRQAVRHQVLILACVGSNPAAPAITFKVRTISALEVDPTGASPSGKAPGFDPACVGSNPAAPAIHLKLFKSSPFEQLFHRTHPQAGTARVQDDGLHGERQPRSGPACRTSAAYPLGDAYVGKFSDGEISVEINENVRGKDVFLIQPTCAPTNDNLMELVVLADAFRRSSASRITAVIPYFGYARQDRRPRSARVPISAKVVADMLDVVGVNRVLTVDLHADQIQGFFDMPVDNIYGSPVWSTTSRPSASRT